MTTRIVISSRVRRISSHLLQPSNTSCSDPVWWNHRTMGLATQRTTTGVTRFPGRLLILIYPTVCLTLIRCVPQSNSSTDIYTFRADATVDHDSRRELPGLLGATPSHKAVYNFSLNDLANHDGGSFVCLSLLSLMVRTN